MKTAIINGFRKCGLFPFDANAVDYSKCVKDKFSKLKRRFSERITIKDFDVAIRVFSLIRSELRDNGIDTDLILAKIELARSNVSPQRRLQSITAQPSTATTMPTPAETTSQNMNNSIPEVVSFISLNDISVLPLSDMSFVSFSNLLDYDENLEQITQCQNMANSKAPEANSKTINTVVTVAQINVSEGTNESMTETGTIFNQKKN